jgi:hypothetical protein
MKNNLRKKKYLGSSFQKKMLFLVFFAAVIPTVVVGICMYYLIFHMFAWQIAFPEAIAYILMPVLNRVNKAMLVLLPVILAVLWFVALELSHRMAGPIFRIEKELDRRIKGEKVGPLKLRKNDELHSLAEKINQLL